MKIKWLLSAGIFAPAIFWITTIICGLMIEGYDHLRWLVSELGALDSKPQYIFSAGLIISAILNLLFIIGLWKFCRKVQLNILPVLYLALYSFIIGPAVVPMPLPLHGIVGSPFPFIMLSPLLALIVWRNQENYLKIRIAAIISFVVMVHGFLIFFPNVLPEYHGLKQRFLYAGWSVWSGYLSYRMMALSNDYRTDHNRTEQNRTDQIR